MEQFWQYLVITDQKATERSKNTHSSQNMSDLGKCRVGYNQKMFSSSDDRFEGTTKVVNVFRAFTIEHLEKEPLIQTFIFFILNKNYQTKYDFKNWIFSFTFFPLILNLDILKYHNLKSFFSKFVRLSVIYVEYVSMF